MCTGFGFFEGFPRSGSDDPVRKLPWRCANHWHAGCPRANLRSLPGLMTPWKKTQIYSHREWGQKNRRETSDLWGRHQGNIPGPRHSHNDKPGS